ncbi:hypothetical protein Q3G72_006542 [Acer saccharum]|nr:hypothetical protein Q3G72_006542 [Acer saccharum]
MSQNSEDPAAKSHYPEVYDHEKDEWFLCPWMGVVANIKTLEKDGTYNWKYYFVAKNLGDKLYGWVARKDDSELHSLVGDHLRKIGDLKTVFGKEAEDQRKTLKLVTKLAHTLETKKARLKEIKTKYNETSTSVDFGVFCVKLKECVFFVDIWFCDASQFRRSDIIESGLEEHEYRQYRKLKKVYLKVKISNSVYRCLFRYGKRKRDYCYKELSEHASGVGRSRSRSRREKAQHLALENYVNRYLLVKDRPEPATKPTSRPASKSHYSKVTDHGKDQLFVFPWVGIVANIKTIKKDGKYVGESGSKLRDKFRNKGFNVLKKSFEVDHHGKDYYAEKNQGDKPYGWVARDDDYNSKSLIGSHLRKIGDLKTVSKKEVEDQRKTMKLVTKLVDTLETKNVHHKEMTRICSETSTTLDIVMREKDDMVKYFNECKLRYNEDTTKES